ncbi:MAG: hypothetical protein F6K09_37420, partial [Merismopedia sp. SIO2A8]|nr:hypothetical protein [Merismopedia sp. SIO2A8]
MTPKRPDAQTRVFMHSRNLGNWYNKFNSLTFQQFRIHYLYRVVLTISLSLGITLLKDARRAVGIAPKAIADTAANETPLVAPSIDLEDNYLSQTQLNPMTTAESESQTTIESAAQELDLSPEIIEGSPVLRRWLEEVPNVLEEIRHQPSFRT